MDGLARRAPGFALVLRAGVTAWMQACRSVASPVRSASPSDAAMHALPGGVRAEVTVLLAEMALAAATEVAR